MDAITDTDIVQLIPPPDFDVHADAPHPEWIRGKCPACGGWLISNCYYVGTRGYKIAHECWNSLSDKPTCAFRKII